MAKDYDSTYSPEYPYSVFRFIADHSVADDRLTIHSPTTRGRPLGDFFRILTQDVRAWKKTREGMGLESRHVLTELLLPAGTRVYMDHPAVPNESPTARLPWTVDARKMRASQAQVVNQHVILSSWKAPFTGNSVFTSTSLRSGSFQYVRGELSVPKLGFSDFPAQCEGGIHFFLKMMDALQYDY